MIDIQKIINETTAIAIDLIENTDMNDIQDVSSSTANFDINDKYAIFMDFEPYEDPNYGLWFTFYEKNDGDGFNIEEQDTTNLTEESVRYNLGILLNGCAVKECLEFESDIKAVRG